MRHFPLRTTQQTWWNGIEMCRISVEEMHTHTANTHRNIVRCGQQMCECKYRGFFLRSSRWGQERGSRKCVYMCWKSDNLIDMEPHASRFVCNPGVKWFWKVVTYLWAMFVQLNIMVAIVRARTIFSIAEYSVSIILFFVRDALAFETTIRQTIYQQAKRSINSS